MKGKANWHLTRAGVILAVLAALALAGCGKDERRAQGRMDTPAHHTLRGHDHLDKGDWEEAMRSFQLAITLDRKYSPGYAGKAVALAMGSASPRVKPGKAASMAENAHEALEEALDLADSNGDKRVAHTAGIRVFRLTRPKGWLEDAVEHYNEAMEFNENARDPNPHFYVARAYRDAFKIQDAIKHYQVVLGMDTPMTGRADAEMAVVQKIQRAAPGSSHGKVIAFAPTITRADIAGLFIEEMRLDKIFQRGGQTTTTTAFRAPGQAAAIDRPKGSTATDVQEHPLRSDILEVLKIGVRGLEVDPSNKFFPNLEVNRAEFAVMIEDILVKVTGEEAIKTKFIGQPSPFRDIRNDTFYFNAIQTVTTRNLKEPENKVNGIFGAGSSISGADALLVIRLLKDELRSYLR